MASIKPHGKKWRAQVYRHGVRDSMVCDSKGQAVAWAGQREAEIASGQRGEVPNLLVRDLLRRYRENVTPAKKGRRWEEHRLLAIERSTLGAVRLRALDSPHVAAWQQERLRAVSEGSVRRERNLLNNAFRLGVLEWRWLRKNPFDGVRRPKDSRPKTRVATDAEVEALTRKASEQLRRAIVVGVETGMRASEIASRPRVQGRVAYLLDSKNGEAREIPLTAKAAEALPVDLSAGSISELFRRLAGACGFDGLTFHCLRRTAATRLSKRLTPWELCRMFGWKDPRIPMKHYYSATAEEIARKL